MLRLLVYWAYHCRRWLLGVGFSASILVLLAAAFVEPSLSGWLLIGLGLVVLAVRRWERFFWGFVKRRWRVQIAGDRRVLVYHDPKGCDRALLDSIVQCADETVKELRQQFGFSLRRPLVVFLFPTRLELSRTVGWDLGAGALEPADAIVLAADGFYNRTTLQESLRHECAHLFSGYWGKLEPPFKSEGLATWLQRTCDGESIDFRALALLKGSKLLPLRMLWSSPDFYADRSYNYVIAGSFTGFVIRSFGWEAYRLFFRVAFSVSAFRPAFEKCFGTPFHTAAQQWLDQLLDREHEFMPALEGAVREASIDAAFNSWQLFRCLEDFEELDRHYQANGRAIWMAACTCFMLRRYEQASKLWCRILHSNDERCRTWRGLSWLRLGEVYDIQGQREKAIDSYHQVLAQPDWADWGWQTSTHEEAKRYLQKPLTEQEWWDRYIRSARRARKARN